MQKMTTKKPLGQNRYSSTGSVSASIHLPTPIQIAVQVHFQQASIFITHHYNNKIQPISCFMLLFFLAMTIFSEDYFPCGAQILDRLCPTDTSFSRGLGTQSTEDNRYDGAFPTRDLGVTTTPVATFVSAGTEASWASGKLPLRFSLTDESIHHWYGVMKEVVGEGNLL
ncbi:hypothetical protein ACJX0J_007277, partial [Zea mays]